jgi:hypothetical protein
MALLTDGMQPPSHSQSSALTVNGPLYLHGGADATASEPLDQDARLLARPL